jgi:DNA-binding MarR family transcriptional regulator/predicted GNAT family N-acyltransferase
MDAMKTLRLFNRAYTKRIGVLSDSYLGAGRPLGPSRVLFELGESPRVLSELRAELGLDSGYMSRLLRDLEADGLVTTTADSADARRRVVKLSAKGRRAWQRLDERSDGHASSLVQSLSPSQQGRLAEALSTAQRLLDLGSVSFEPTDIFSPEAQEALDQYFAELDRRFDGGFDRQSGGADADGEKMRAPTGAFVLCRIERRVIGCGGIQRVDKRRIELKRMWIHTDWRGEGLGRRMLSTLEDAARVQGATTVVLDTNRILTEAVAMYERSGYQPIERYNDNPFAHHWFAKQLTPRR